MKRFFPFVFLFVLFSSTAFSQTPFDWWYFGTNAGMHFPPGGGAPVVVSNGQLNTSEGCSSISDASGNLLFYTDGISVWNKNHIIMPNGTGLMGNSSSTMSSLVVPKPGNNNQYYLFTTDDFGNNLANGLRYSIVDMSLNGGLGDVVVAGKNTLLVAPAEEKVTATRNAAGTGYWIVTKTYPGNTFHAYSLTAAGLNTTPVVTNIGPMITDVSDGVSYLKISSQGTKIALAHPNIIGDTEIYDFDPATGILSNPIILDGSTISAPDFTFYGLEFSPNGQYLYISTWSGGGLFRVDLNAGTPAAVQASFTNLGTGIGGFIGGSLQLGPDGKIYMATGDNTLAVVNSPNLASCNLVIGQVSLSGSAFVSLPNFISGLSFNTPTHVDGSLDVLTPDGIFCGNQITPIFQLTNTGDTTIFNFSISYTVNGGTPMTYNWSGSLDTTQSVTITLPILNVGIGMQNLQMTLNTVNNAADGNGSNNSDNANINVIAITGQPLPLQEGFEGLAFPPAHFQVVNAAGTTWQKTNSAARAGVASVYIDNFTLNNQLGAVDDIRIDGFAFPYNQTITFEFDVAYAPYTVGESDTLQVLISTDCGQTFQTLYDLSGASLYTAPPTNGAFVPTSWSQWKHFSTDLSGHAGNPNVEFIFRCRNSYENNLYLDNINIIASAVSVENPNDLGVVHIFPNPATEILNIEYQGIKQGATAATLFDLSGKVVKSQTLPLNEGFNLAQMQLSDLAKGIYMLQVGVGEKAFREKVVLR